MRSTYTRLLLAAQVVFVLCMGAVCETVTQETCGNGFTDTRGAVTVGDFGENEDAIKLEAFLDAVADFEVQATLLTEETEAACRGLGVSLGVPAADMPEGDVEATCQAVAAQIDEDMTAFQEASLVVNIEVIPGECSADFQAAADCYAECDVNLDIEANPPVCTGGDLWVECSAGCTGECRLPSATADCYGYCEGECEGTCSASCAGSCSGNCYGLCEGTCETVDEATGQCAGACTGTCHGECDATCTGTCTGTCEGSCSAGCVVEVEEGGCEGQCQGECSGEYTPVRCEGGEFEIQEASAECDAACEAEVSFEAECTPPQAVVSYEGDISDVVARAQIFAAAMEENLPQILAVFEQAGYVLDSVAVLVDTSADGLEAAGNIGARAVACAALAVNLAYEIEIEVEITVDASVEVSDAVQTE